MVTALLATSGGAEGCRWRWPVVGGGGGGGGGGSGGWLLLLLHLPLLLPRQSVALTRPVGGYFSLAKTPGCPVVVVSGAVVAMMTVIETSVLGGKGS